MFLLASYILCELGSIGEVIRSMNWPDNQFNNTAKAI